MAAIDQPTHGRHTEFHLPSTKGGTISGTTLVGYVDDLGSLEQSRSIVDLLAYQDDDVSRLAGAKEATSISLTVQWVPGDTDHTALTDAFDNATLTHASIQWKDGANFAVAAFSGYISKLNISHPKEDKVTAEFEIAISGSVDFDLSGT